MNMKAILIFYGIQDIINIPTKFLNLSSISLDNLLQETQSEP